MTNKFEIPFNYFDGKHHETIIGLLTGLTLEEIEAATPRRKFWYTRDYMHAFFKLGFNTNPRFIRFDPATEYPCIMRCQKKPDDGHWYGWVYYDNLVYHTHGYLWEFDKWIEEYSEDFRVTSMLQVWI